MSRPTPIPRVKIQQHLVEDPDTGHQAINVIIDVMQTEDTSIGFIVLDEIEDILILKEAVDRFIIERLKYLRK